MTLSTTPFGRTGQSVTRIGFGAWAIGGSWGDVSEAEAKATLEAALDAGMTFIDTADVYGDGRSERIIRDVLKSRSGTRPFVATKAGRRLSPHVASGYTIENIEAFIDRSLANLGTDCLDLVQLHCPPTDVYYTPALFDGLEGLKAKGKIARGRSAHGIRRWRGSGRPRGCSWAQGSGRPSRRSSGWRCLGS